MTLLVCSSCHAPLPEGRAHCPRCGPGSLALLSGERPAPTGQVLDEVGAARLGRALGSQYRVLRLVGRGGFAEVYEVTDADLERRLAVKVLRADLPWGPATLSRFKQEARAIARLSHPNTVPIYFVGEGEGLVFYSMPFLEGRTLAEVLRTEGPFAAWRAVDVVVPILGALQQAHEHGLVHRDVKPDNILIEAGSGRPLLVDFGIVKALDGPAHLTESGFIVGTPLYMSPEQAVGGRVDARADIYGVGVVLFQLLTGAPPFEGNDSQEIVGRHLHEPVPVAALSRDGVPAWLSGVVLRCLAKHPEDRYPSAAALRDELLAGRGALPATAGVGSISAGARPAAASEAPTVAVRRARRGKRLLPWAAAAAGITGVALFSFASAFANRPDPLLVVENRLAGPIALSLQDTTGFMVAAGDSVRLAVPRDRPLEAHWAVVQPAALDGRLLGRPVQGSIVTDRARGELREVVDAEYGGEVWFAPRVVNRSGRPLSAAVLGAGDTIGCGCSIAPGDSMDLGYYPLEPASAVRLTDPAGLVAQFDSLDETRNPVTGTLVLRVDSAAFAAAHAR